MIRYKLFNKYILRTPINPLINTDNLGFDLDSFTNKKEFLHLIKVASPALYDKFIQWKKYGLKKEKEKQRLLESLLKYYVRSSMRSTPFGLFAGLSVGKFSDVSKIVLNDEEKHRPHTRLDMNYLCSLIQDLAKLTEVRDLLIYYPNTSLYSIGEKLRYVEYYYVKTNRKHQISAVEDNEYIDKVLKLAKSGAKKSELVNILIDDEISESEASGYIDILIDNQILISNLEPTVTGLELQDFLLQQLEKIGFTKNGFYKNLKKIKLDIAVLDTAKIGSEKAISIYSTIAERLKELETSFEEKYLFQTDLFLSTETNILEDTLKDDLQAAILVLNKLTFKAEKTNISEFAKAFQERYEDQEISLMLAMDVETGIGYLQGNSGDINPLIDDLALPSTTNENQSSKLNWDKRSHLLQKKYQDAITNNQRIIEIKDKDLEGFTESWDDLPSTISSMTKLLIKGGRIQIIINSVGGSSAANLLGRFAYGGNDIYQYIKEITQKEKELDMDIIHAEIVHLPESRTGNILARPIFRDYEIPYLAQAAVDRKYQIQIDDLMVSVKNNKVLLRSKRLNKEILPHLTNAHNYSYNSLPIYHFLSDMQTQQKRGGLHFSWGSLERLYDTFPRVIYKNCILSLAYWNIKKEEIEALTKAKGDKDLLESTKIFTNTKSIPDKVVLSDSDNELLIDFTNIISIKMFMSLVKNRPSFKLKEFLFSENEGLVVDKAGNSYTNEVIFSFYKEEGKDEY